MLICTYTFHNDTNQVRLLKKRGLREFHFRDPFWENDQYKDILRWPASRLK